MHRFAQNFVIPGIGTHLQPSAPGRIYPLHLQQFLWLNDLQWSVKDQKARRALPTVTYNIQVIPGLP